MKNFIRLLVYLRIQMVNKYEEGKIWENTHPDNLDNQLFYCFVLDKYVPEDDCYELSCGKEAKCKSYRMINGLEYTVNK